MTPKPRARAALLAAGLGALIAGCVVVPQTREVYDPDCQTNGKQIVLEAAVLGGFYGCVGEGCAAMMATMGIVTAASVVISGSIAVVGNVLYWAEKQGRCTRPATATTPSAPK